MMKSTTFSLNRPDNKSLSALDGSIDTFFGLFDSNTEIFTKAPKGTKGGYANWQNDLLTPSEAQDRLEEGDNIGIKFGESIQGDYLIGIDREKNGTLPEKSKEVIDNHALGIWQSPHIGKNRLLKVSKTAFDYLSQFKEKVTITDSSGHDLEILTSKHCLIPPSEINHTNCNTDTKPCDGFGIGQYQLLSLNPNAPVLTWGEAKRLTEPLPVERSENNSNTESEPVEAQDFTVPELPSDFEPNSYFRENIPGNDSFTERLDYMVHGNWDKGEFERLWTGEYANRSDSELSLRAYVAWFFAGDRKMVQYIFEEILPAYRNEPLKYELNEYQKRDVLDFESYVSPPYYCKGISFDLRKQVAKEVMESGEVTVSELEGRLYYNTGGDIEIYSKRSIQNALHLLKKQGLIERESNTVWKNKKIDREYMAKLRSLIEDYDYNVPVVKYDYNE